MTLSIMILECKFIYDEINDNLLTNWKKYKQDLNNGNSKNEFL